MITFTARLCLAVLVLAGGPAAQDGNPAPSLLKARFSKLPIYFVENRGIYSDDVAFYIQGADKTLFFTKNGITFRLRGKDRPWVVKLEFVGANPDVRPRGEDLQQAVFSYFKGPEKDWKTGLRSYAKIVYEDLWPGIDLVYRGTVHRLKYEFVVSPGADPRRIRLRYAGATAVRVLDSGALRVETPVQEFEDAPPVAFQDVEGTRRPVEVAFESAGNSGGAGHVFAFRVGDYDQTLPLVLDPALIVYCGYIGGADIDQAWGIAVDPAGNAYVAGWTMSTEATFPVKTGPDLTHEAWGDCFVAKVSASGSSLVYCGYIGGSGHELVYDGIAVDAAGHAYVTGATGSTEATFPVKGGPDLTHNGLDDVFVAKVSADGTSLVYCGYIGGASWDYSEGIAVDVAGNAYVTGVTSSTETTFPVKVGPDLTHNGGVNYYRDAFVAKVSASGQSLVYCGYIGGSNDDWGYGIAVDPGGNAYVVGDTYSTEATFPVRVGPDLTANGGDDAFVAKISTTGSSLVYCGYVGGSASDRGHSIAVDAARNAYIAGVTLSTEATFPVKIGPDLTSNGYADCFVARVSANGTSLDYCGYIGGSGPDTGEGIAVGGTGAAYVCGVTYSTEATFPVLGGPGLTYNRRVLPFNGEDGFVAKVEPQGASLGYCGYIGGSGDDLANSIEVDRSGNAYVAGWTNSHGQSFPVRVGPSLVYKGGFILHDGFVAKIALTLLEGPSAVQTGGTVAFALTASDDVGLLYQVASSFGTGPMSIDTRKIHLSPDPVLYLSTWNAHPGMFVNYTGRISPHGDSKAFINLPQVSALIGLSIHSAFVTLDPAAPSGVRSISNTSSFTITK